MTMQLEDFKKLPADEQRTVLANMRRQFTDRIQASLDQAVNHHELESQLVPQLTFKKPTPPGPPTRVEVSPPTGDPEEAARDFFRRFRDTKSIRIGSVLYERS